MAVYILILLFITSICGMEVLSESNKQYSTPTIPYTHPPWDPFETELIAANPVDVCDIADLKNAEELVDKAVLIRFCKSIELITLTN